MLYNRFSDKSKQITKDFKAGDFFCPCGICRDQIVDADFLKDLQIAKDNGVDIEDRLIGLIYQCQRYKTTNKLGPIDSKKKIDNKLKDLEDKLIKDLMSGIKTDLKI